MRRSSCYSVRCLSASLPFLSLSLSLPRSPSLVPRLGDAVWLMVITRERQKNEHLVNQKTLRRTLLDATAAPFHTLSRGAGQGAKNKEQDDRRR